MLDILDKKGNPLGLPQDYEYRGKRREMDRDTPMKRAKVACVILALLFAALALIIIFRHITQQVGSTGGTLLGSLGLFAFAALFGWMAISSKRKHLQLLERIGKS